MGFILPSPQTGQCVSLGNINTMSKSHERNQQKHKKQQSKMQIYPLDLDPVLLFSFLWFLAETAWFSCGSQTLHSYTLSPGDVRTLIALSLTFGFLSQQKRGFVMVSSQHWLECISLFW